MVKFLDLKAQYLQIKDEIDHVIRDVIETSAFVGGQYLADFERNFASFQGQVIVLVLATAQTHLKSHWRHWNCQSGQK